MDASCCLPLLLLLLTLVVEAHGGGTNRLADPAQSCITFCINLPNATTPAPVKSYTRGHMDAMCAATMNYARCAAKCDVANADEYVVDTMEDRWTYCSHAQQVLQNEQCFRRATESMATCHKDTCKRRLKIKIDNWDIANDTEKRRQLEEACDYWYCSHQCLFSRINSDQCSADGLELVTEFGRMAVHYWIKKIHLYACSVSKLKTIDHLFGKNCCKLMSITHGWGCKGNTTTTNSSSTINVCALALLAHLLHAQLLNTILCRR